LGERLQTCRDIDSVSVDVIAINDDVTDVDANAKRYLPICGYAHIALGHPPLHVNRAANRIDDTGKLEQQAVASGRGDAATVLGDLRVDQLSPVGLERGQRAALVAAHEAGIARDIGGDYRGESALVARHPLPFD